MFLDPKLGFVNDMFWYFGILNNNNYGIFKNVRSTRLKSVRKVLTQEL